MIRVDGLVKRYGPKTVLEGINFAIPQGCLLGLLGLNGAGKTTLLNIITGCLGATEGSVTVNGYDVSTDSLNAKKAIGYLPELIAFYNDMRVREYLDFICDVKRVRKNRRAYVAELCEQVGISHITGRVIRNLSLGYRQRVGLVQAMIGDPKVLILDEPTSGLDPSQIIKIRTLISEIGKTRTVIISSHILSEIQTLCTRIIMLHNGRIVADSPTEHLYKDITKSNMVVARIVGDPQEVLKALGQLIGVTELRVTEEKEPGAFEYVIESTNVSGIRKEIFHILSDAKLPLVQMHTNALSLEDIFLNIVQRQCGEDISEADSPNLV